MKEFSGWNKMKNEFRENGILPLWHQRYDGMLEADILADILRRHDGYLRIPFPELTPMEKKFVEVINEWE